MVEILATDIGYGYTKAKTRRKQTLIPSIVGPAEAIRFESDLVSPNGHSIAVEVDGRTFFVGHQAELQSASASQTLDVTRTGSIEQKALFYAAASELVKTTSDEVAVVTGLPVADFDERNKAALSDMLRGRHEIHRRGKHTRQFEVSNVYVLPQGVGCLFALVLDNAGKLVDTDLARGRVGVVDVGMLTSNYILMDRLRYVEVSSDSITSGMSEVLTKVAKELKQEHGLDWTLHLGKVDQAVRARSVEVYGQQVDITPLVKPHLEALAETVISKARSLWGAGADLKAVVLTGGGSLEMAPYVRRSYPHVRTVDDDPQFGNVTGYLRAGWRHFQ